MEDVVQDLLKRAKTFATQSHARLDATTRKSRRPFDAHLKAVATLVAEVSDDPRIIAAAWLHESVDKTAATHHELEAEFGEEVALLVRELTPVSRPSDGDEMRRLAIDREHVAKASSAAKTIRLADLIDTLREACKVDQPQSRQLLTESPAWMEVLRDGDSRLYRRADRTISKCADRLGMQRPPAIRARLELEHPQQRGVFGQERMARVFAEAFGARDIAEPLRSFDAYRSAQHASELMDFLSMDMIGIREAGVVIGYAWRVDLTDGICGDAMRRFARDQVVADEASLSEVILVLSRYESCFVEAMGSIVGVIRKGDVEKPIVRMWLFGMITILEMNLATMIRERWPNDEWKPLCPPKRLAKAESLCAERERIDQRSQLVDCLQFSDKATILFKDEDVMKLFGFSSKSQADRIVRDLESLRNNLAHGQQIVTHDWPQIVRMTQRLALQSG